MGKKRSKFVQQQTYNRHLQNKVSSNLNHAMNKSNRRIESYRQDYENSIKEIMSGFIKNSGLDPDKIPNNSRILIYELLRKNLQTKHDQYSQYIKDHSNDENINEYYEAQKLCLDSLEQIDWIYDWTKPITVYGLSDGETYDLRLEKTEKILQESEKKFDSILDIPEIIDSLDKPYCNKLKFDFYRFCGFIIEKRHEIDKYYIYISNTIKNLKIFNTEDPIIEFMLKPYKNEEFIEITDCEK